MASASVSPRSRPLAFWEHALPRLLAWHTSLAPKATSVGRGTSTCGPLCMVIAYPARTQIAFSSLSAVRHSESSLGVPLGEQALRGLPPLPPFSSADPARELRLARSRPCSCLLAGNPCSPGHPPLQTRVARSARMCVLRYRTVACGASLSGCHCVSSCF